MVDYTRPRDWDFAIKRIIKDPGLTMVMGPTDSGKTTFIAQLMDEALQYHISASIIDADLGQKSVGPPAMIGMAEIERESGLSSNVTLHFVGDTTPHGHIAEVLSGINHLRNLIKPENNLIAIDTAGLISGQMGTSLHYQCATSLDPKYLVFIRRAQEMEGLIQAMSYSKWAKVFVIDASRAARRMTVIERRHRRQSAFMDYFKDSQICEIKLEEAAIFPPETRAYNRRELKGLLIGLNDMSNTTVGMGIVTDHLKVKGIIRLVTPVRRVNVISGIRLGFIKMTSDGQELGRITARRA